MGCALAPTVKSAEDLMERRCQPPLPRRLLAAGRSARQGVEHCRIMAAMRSNGSTDALVNLSFGGRPRSLLTSNRGIADERHFFRKS